MKATKADVICSKAQAIQNLHDDMDMLYEEDFDSTEEYWKEVFQIENDITEFYHEIGEVLKDQDIDN